MSEPSDGVDGEILGDDNFEEGERQKRDRVSEQPEKKATFHAVPSAPTT